MFSGPLSFRQIQDYNATRNFIGRARHFLGIRQELRLSTDPNLRFKPAGTCQAQLGGELKITIDSASHGGKIGGSGSRKVKSFQRPTVPLNTDTHPLCPRLYYFPRLEPHDPATTIKPKNLK